MALKIMYPRGAHLSKRNVLVINGVDEYGRPMEIRVLSSEQIVLADGVANLKVPSGGVFTIGPSVENGRSANFKAIIFDDNKKDSLHVNSLTFLPAMTHGYCVSLKPLVGRIEFSKTTSVVTAKAVVYDVRHGSSFTGEIPKLFNELRESYAWYLGNPGVFVRPMDCMHRLISGHAKEIFAKDDDPDYLENRLIKELDICKKDAGATSLDVIPVGRIQPSQQATEFYQDPARIRDAVKEFYDASGAAIVREIFIDIFFSGGTYVYGRVISLRGEICLAQSLPISESKSEIGFSSFTGGGVLSPLYSLRSCPVKSVSLPAGANESNNVGLAAYLAALPSSS